jgi:hypothetical protein
MSDNMVDRAALTDDLEQARTAFHRILASLHHDDWDKPSVGTRWTNEELLYHIVFGYMVVQRLLILVWVFGRLPDGVSRVFARMLNAATTPFNAINYYGSRHGARLYSGRRMAAKLDRVIDSLQRSLSRGRDNDFPRHALSDPLGSLLQGLHDARRRLPIPQPTLRLPQETTVREDPRLTPSEPHS